MMQRLSLTFVEGSDSVSLGAAVGKVPPGINRTSKELPLLLLSLLLLSLILVSLLLSLMLHLEMSEYLLLAIDLRYYVLPLRLAGPKREGRAFIGPLLACTIHVG